MAAVGCLENRLETGEHLAGEGAGQAPQEIVAEVFDGGLRQLPQLDGANARHDVQIDVLSVLPSVERSAGPSPFMPSASTRLCQFSAASLTVGLLLGEMCRPLLMSTLTAA